MQKELLVKLQKKIAVGSGIALLGSIVGVILTLACHFVLARYLGPADYGIYALGLNIMSILGIFSMMGLHLGTVRFISIYLGEKNFAKLKGVILSALISVFISSTIIGISCYFMSGFISTSLFKKTQLFFVIRAISLILPIYSTMLLLSFIFRGLHKIKSMLLMTKILHPITILVLAVIFLGLGLGLNGAVSALCSSMVVTTIYGLFLLYRDSPPELSQVHPVFQYSKLLFFSFPLVLLYLSVNLMSRLDILMLGCMTDSTSVGAYSIASRIANFIFLFYAAFNVVFGPIFADLYNRKCISELSDLLKTVTRWNFSLTLPCAIIICAFSSPLMIMFGDKFIIGRFSLIILSIMGVIISFSGSLGNILVMAGHQISEVSFSVLSLVIGILLNFILIRKYEIVGAAIATFLTLSVFNLAKMFYIHKVLRMHPLSPKFKKPLFASFLAGLILFIAMYEFGLPSNPLMLLLIATIFFVAYLSILYFLGLPSEDQILLNAVLNKIVLLKKLS